ncbi:MAG: ribonuclease H-like domain-containing protein [Candidatus Altiarchaeota archaeon]|nr:ribonuclease H-like domain-containing protein [Candidatus Altiarchaeota archaeon]
MLKSTFQHLQGVGETTEKDLWRRGCKTWDHLLEQDYGLPQDTYRRLRAGILESRERLRILDHKYFRDALKTKLAWRAYEDFKEHACFLDIETTGLFPHHHEVTTVCVHTSRETKNYTLGDNLEKLKEDIGEYKYIVTFNGMRFDLPFLTRRMGITFHQLHLDLLYPLRTLGHRGGLKKIEHQLGISRETEGVTGFDAVRLWHAYKHNRAVDVAGMTVRGRQALDLLVKYNVEDTRNLETLAEYAVRKLKKQAIEDSELQAI